MNQRPQIRWLIVLGLAAVAAGIIVFLVNARQVRERREDLANIRRNLDQAQARLRSFEARRSAAAARQARKLSDVKAAWAAAIQARTEHHREDSKDEQEERNRFFAEVDQYHLGIFRALNLPAEKTAKLEAMLDESRRRSDELRDAAMSQGMKFTDPAIQDIEDQERARLQIEEEDLLGPDAYRELHLYANAEGARDVTATLASRLCMGDEPLTATQGSQLTALLANLSPVYVAGARITDGSTIDWVTARAQAATLLSPAQLQVFNQVADLDQSFPQMMAMVKAIKQKARSGDANSR